MVAPCLIFITSSRDGAHVRLEGPLRVTTPSLFSLARRTCIPAGKVSFILRDGGNGFSAQRLDRLPPVVGP